MAETKQERLFNYLNGLCQETGCSIGLHTTKGEEKAESICEKGLLVLGGKALEGTLKIRGYAGEFKKADVDWFFDAFQTDHTVVVAIPKLFEAHRVGDNRGGYEPICEFSQFLKAVSTTLQKEFPEFTSKNKEAQVPPQMILGYYDKDYEFTQNPDCWVYEKSDEKDYVKDLEERKEANERKIEISKKLQKSLNGPSFGR